MTVATYTKVDLKQQLKKMGIKHSDSILVHSSMKSIGNVTGGADAVLDVLSDYMSDGLLVLPTHTWAYIDQNNPIFDVNRSKTCVGILTELFRKRPEVHRSLHPTHSVAALGEDAEQFVAGDENMDTPCGKGSSLWKLKQRKGKILLIGVDLRSNTFIHGIEEWMGVPGRLTDEHELLYTCLSDGTRLQVPSYRHCGDNWSQHYWKVEDILLASGAITEGVFGSARVLVCDAAQLNEDISAMLTVNKELFTMNKTIEPQEKMQFLNMLT